MSLLVVVPTYNEAASIDGLIDGVRTTVPSAAVLIVDDASPDGTGQIADRRAAADPQVHVLHRDRKSGLGEAYLAGFTWALERDYERIAQMDADGSHRAADLPALLSADADLVIGSRWVPGGRVQNWPWLRRAISRGGTRYAKAMLGLPVQDATAGFRAWNHRALASLHLDDVASQGYCFQIDMVRLAHDAGVRIVEVPITFVERTAGTSKMSGAIVREALWRVTLWGVVRWSRKAQAVLRRRPRR